MRDNEKVIMKKRLGIYYLQDKDGIVDGYIQEMLKCIRPCFADLYIIVGGVLTVAGRKTLEKYTDIIYTNIKIENCLDGYHEAVKCFGTELLAAFDEIIFFNNNLMGPVYDINVIFDKIEKSSVEIWGLVPEYADGWGMNSDFLCFTQRMVRSYEFKEYWMEEYQNTGCAQFFEKKGYRWSTYVEAGDLCELNGRPLVFYPKEMLMEYKCPFFLKNTFEMDYGEFLTESVGQPAFELFCYLRETRLYNLDLLWDYILRTNHQADIVKNLHLTYILPDDFADMRCNAEIKDRKIALLIHIYRTDMAQELAQYASYMPENAHIFITTDSIEKKKIIEGIFRKKGIASFEIRIIENRGRDVSSKLVGVKDVILNYDYVCCIHDKKTPHLKPQSIGNGFGYKCFKNIIASKNYVNNVITAFERNPRMGIAVPPEPNHAAFFTTLGFEWVGNYECTKRLADELGIQVPISAYKEPVAPFGSFFWFRPKALKKLYEKDWDYTDFPAEPIADDGTILHAIERIYPFVAQAEGYYPAVIMSQSFAAIEYANLRYYTRCYNEILMKHGMLYSQKTMCNKLDERLK